MGRKHLHLRTLYKNHLVYFRFQQVVSSETASLSGARCQSPCSDARAPSSRSVQRHSGPPQCPFKESSSRFSEEGGGGGTKGGLGVMGEGVEASRR